ncbi:hypothetical protein DXG01_002393 [Tephrocybe rancida]|nr:hypothetical protein DXG01_002393 [Tephrocybe rancida]
MKLLYSFLCVAVVTVFVEAKITHSELAENKAKGLRLMSLENGVDPIWKTEEERLDLVRGHINFFDITEVFDPDAPIGSERKTANHPPYRPPTHQSEVKAIIANLSLPNIKSHVNHLTQYNNRYPTDETGAQASKWILKTVQDIIAKYPKRGATVKPFHHPGWNQTSVIARIPGSIESAVTIVGAHLDSFNHEFTFGRAPGADYDATGCASLLETFRALLASGFKPTKPVEFHWYSAQNIGNVGSLAVAQSYKKAGTEVKAMMNVDGTAYVKPMTTPVFGIVQANTFPKYMGSD